MKSRTLQDFIKRWEEFLQGRIMRGYVSQVQDQNGKGRDAAEVLKMMAADALRLREILETMWEQEIEPPHSDMILRLSLAAMPKALGAAPLTKGTMK